jgi:hypothetical protein
VPGPLLRLAPDAEGRARLQRGRLLFATLAAARLDPDTESRGALAVPRQWLPSWKVIDTSPLAWRGSRTISSWRAMEKRAGDPRSIRPASPTR